MQVKNSFQYNYSKQKKRELDKIKKSPFDQYLPQSKNVDINILLNRIKLNQKNIKKEKLVFLGLGSLAVGLMGVFISIVN
jgi:hypothetical protein